MVRQSSYTLVNEKNGSRDYRGKFARNWLIKIKTLIRANNILKLYFSHGAVMPVDVVASSEVTAKTMLRLCMSLKQRPVINAQPA